MKLIIEDDEGHKTVVPFAREELTIGRADGNRIRLAERNVSRRHARLREDDGSLVIEDLGSSNGVRVNGDRIRGPMRIAEGDLIQIGDYDLAIQGRPSAGAFESREAAAASPAALAETAIIRAADVRGAEAEGEERQLAPGEMPSLLCVTGKLRGIRHGLRRTPSSVGRTADNDVCIDHPSISRRHCRFVLERGAWKIHDDGSANGVRVNGERYTIASVQTGDTVELGHVQLRFCAPGDRFELPPGGEQAQGVEDLVGARAGVRAPGILASRRRGTLLAYAGVSLLAALFAFLVAHGRPGRGPDTFHPKVAAAATFADSSPAEGKPTEVYQGIAAALAAGDADAARAQLERCAGTSSPDCERAKDLAGAVRASYAKAHLGRGLAARAAGKTDVCAGETALVLAFDPGNAEATALFDRCAPQPKALEAQIRESQIRESPTRESRTRAPTGELPARKQPPAPARLSQPREEEKSQEARDALAARAIEEGKARMEAGDYAGAIARFSEAVDRKPSGPLLANAYRSLGIAHVYAGDARKGVQYFKLYLPFCPPAEREQLDLTIARYGG